MDAKGRVNVPSAFRKLMQTASQDRFVVRKNIYEKCLDLYPMQEWERQLENIRRSINPYNRRHAGFLREFHRGTAEVQVDSNGRILIPRRLLDYAMLEKEVVFAGQDGKIEIWSQSEYDSVEVDQEAFMKLADDVLGGIDEVYT